MSIWICRVLILAVCLLGLGFVGHSWAEDADTVVVNEGVSASLTNDLCAAGGTVDVEPDLPAAGELGALGGFCDDCEGGCSIWCLSDNDCNRQCPFGFGSCNNDNRCLCACL